jgi:transposase InsO family protein
MPMMNGYAECFVKTIKRECLDHIIFFSEDALRKTIAEYMVHYHMERPHQGIDNRIIEPEVKTYRNTGRIVKRARLGGLLNYYYRADDPGVGDATSGKEDKAAA